jgi:hypothetical protein
MSFRRIDARPTVVFDSGWEVWEPAWSTVQPQSKVDERLQL